MSAGRIPPDDSGFLVPPEWAASMFDGMRPSAEMRARWAAEMRARWAAEDAERQRQWNMLTWRQKLVRRARRYWQPRQWQRNGRRRAALLVYPEIHDIERSSDDGR